MAFPNGTDNAELIGNVLARVSKGDMDIMTASDLLGIIPGTTNYEMLTRLAPGGISTEDSMDAMYRQQKEYEKEGYRPNK